MIKICGLREAHDVTAAIDSGANAVGFVFADSVRKVSPCVAASISRNVPALVRRVAVMLHPSNAEWLAVLEQFGPDVLQADAGDFASLEVPDSVQRWPVYREGGDGPQSAGLHVYEGARSGSGDSVDWSQASVHAANGGMILAGGLNADNVDLAIRTVRPAGVDVSSGVESARGQKDVRKISDFISAVRAAEKTL